MKQCIECGVEKTLLEFHRDTSCRDGVRSACKACVLARKAIAYASDREGRLAKQKVYYEANRAAVLAYAASYREVNRDRLAVAVAARKGRDWNPLPRTDAERLARRVEMKLRRAARNRASASFRRKGVRRATPHWVDQRAIFELFLKARTLTVMTGFQWHVDHVVPLNSPVVCGLHWHQNLEVLPWFANISKSNQFWPDMPQ